MSKISTRVVCVNGKRRRNTGTPRNVHVEICQIERTECSEVCFGVPGFTTCLDKPLQGAKLGFFRGGGGGAGWGGGGGGGGGHNVSHPWY